MPIFDPHAHMTSRTTDDYRAMAAAGIEVVLEPAFWLGQPRTSPGTFVDYFNLLLGWEPFRASQYAVRHVAALALNPKEANDDRVREPVLELLPRYLAKDRVVAVGEVGYDSITRVEDDVLARQVELAKAHGLPVLLHTPHRDKYRGTTRAIDVLRESGIDPGLVVVDHNNELTAGLVLDAGHWAAFSIYPDTKVDEERMVRILTEHGTDRMIVNSACDWGHSDPLKVPAVADAMAKAGFAQAEITKVTWDNPVAFFGRSGRLDLQGPLASGDSFEGNSVERGER
jgi:predicted metal-dependent TIM-barrel fold hydrolase